MLDIIFFIFLIFYFIKGYKTGLLLTIIKGIAIFIALIIAAHFSITLSQQLFGNVKEGFGKRIFPLISFSILFFVVKFSVTLLGSWIQRAISFPIIGTANRIAGGIFYAMIFVFIASLFLYFLNSLQLINSENKSVVINNLLPISPYIFEMLGSFIPILKDTFHKLSEYVGTYYPSTNYKNVATN